MEKHVRREPGDGNGNPAGFRVSDGALKIAGLTVAILVPCMLAIATLIGRMSNTDAELRVHIGELTRRAEAQEANQSDLSAQLRQLEGAVRDLTTELRLLRRDDR